MSLAGYWALIALLFMLDLELTAPAPTHADPQLSGEHALVRALERGDSDLSGSTVRTLFVVCLVCFIVPVITVCIIRFGGWLADNVGGIGLR